MQENEIETRPLICGNIGKQPFYSEIYGEKSFEFTDDVHEYGLYLPNNFYITEEEITKICEVVNGAIK